MRLNRREFLGGATALAAGSAFGAAKKAGAGASVLLITVEDLGAWMLGIYGNKAIKTPQLDIQGRSGIRLMNACTAAPAPEPGMACLVSGLAPMELSRAHGTIADTLRQNGYQAEAAKTPPASIEACTKATVDFLHAQIPGRPFFYNVNYAPLRAEGVPNRFVKLYEDSNFSELGWLPAADNATQPDQLRDPAEHLRRAAGAISYLDEQIPLLRGALVEKKLYESTITIVTGTNGQLLGRHGLWGDGNASKPPNMYDEVVRVPFLCSWPGQTPAEVYRIEAVSLYDVARTIYALAGIAGEGGAAPGRNFAPVLLNQQFPKKSPWHNLVFAELNGTFMARDNRYKLVLQPDGSGELFDLQNDAGEGTNRFNDGEYLNVKARLTKAVGAWRDTFRAG